MYVDQVDPNEKPIAEFTADTIKGQGQVKVQVLSLEVTGDVTLMRTAMTLLPSDSPGKVSLYDAASFTPLLYDVEHMVYYKPLQNAHPFDKKWRVGVEATPYLSPGEPFMHWTYFDAPDDRVDQLDLTFNDQWPVVEDVPVAYTDQAANGSAPATSASAGPHFTRHYDNGYQVGFEVQSLNVVDGLAELRVLITPSVDGSATSAPESMGLSKLWPSVSDEPTLSDPSHHTAYVPVVGRSLSHEIVPGEPYVYQVWFPAPEEDVTQLDVTVSASWPRVLNVPVVRSAPEPDQRARYSRSDFDELRTVEDATVAYQLDTTPLWGSVWDYAEYARVDSLATPDEGVVTLASDILFASDSAELSQVAKDAIADLVTDVASGAAVSVDGHTDTVDDDAHNDDLSQRRAQAVADAITAVRPDLKLTVTGHGERDLKVPETGDDVAEARAQNRRVELTLGSNPAQPVPTPTPVTSSAPRTGTSATVLPDPQDAKLLPGAKLEVPVDRYPGSTLRIEVEQVKVRGALTQADVIATLVDPPTERVSLYDAIGSFHPALVDRTNLLRYRELSRLYQSWPSQGDLISTYLEDGRPHRFRSTFPAPVAKTDKIDLLIDSQLPVLADLPVTYEGK